MIKKNTKIIFEDGDDNGTDELVGGMPLSKGDLVHIHREDKSVFDYEVTDKTIDCFMGDTDQIVNITYKLKKK